MTESGMTYGDIFKTIVNLPEPKAQLVDFVFLGMPAVDMTSVADKITDAHDFMEGVLNGSGFYAQVKTAADCDAVFTKLYEDIKSLDGFVDFVRKMGSFFENVPECMSMKEDASAYFERIGNQFNSTNLMNTMLHIVGSV
jgi:hypothetical protein